MAAHLLGEIGSTSSVHGLASYLLVREELPEPLHEPGTSRDGSSCCDHKAGCTRCRASRRVRYLAEDREGLNIGSSSVGMITMFPSKAVSALCAGKKNVYPLGSHSTLVLRTIFLQLRDFFESGILNSVRRKRPLNPVTSRARKRESS